VSDTAGDLDELLLVGTFLRRPGAELQIVPLELDAIIAAMARCQTPVSKRNSKTGPQKTELRPAGESLF
jgi:hypothetical protein